jgi:hypothetical protein
VGRNEKKRNISCLPLPMQEMGDKFLTKSRRKRKTVKGMAGKSSSYQKRKGRA